ncbi:hypothetical protein ACOMHN_047804 [Nucella lapillus]
MNAIENYDVIFLTETWLKTQGSEATIAELTPLDFLIKSMPRTTGTGGGVAVLYRNSLVSNINFVNLDSPYRTFQNLRLCKPRRRTREVTSRKLKDIDLDVFKADVTTSLSIISPDAGDQAAQLNTCLGELLDLHAPLTTRRVTDRTSAPWMTLDIKAAKQERRRTERQWQQTGLTVHRQIYCHERNVVREQLNYTGKHLATQAGCNLKNTKVCLPRNGEQLNYTGKHLATQGKRGVSDMTPFEHTAVAQTLSNTGR